MDRLRAQVIRTMIPHVQHAPTYTEQRKERVQTVYEDELAAAKARIVKQGPCAFCGDGYAAHRLIDAQMGRTGAGDSIGSVADDYDTSVREMVIAWTAYVDLLHDSERFDTDAEAQAAIDDSKKS